MGERRKHTANRNFIERWNRLTPAEKDNALRKLPPERRREFERKLDEYEKLTPNEKRALRERLNRFSEMSPEQQDRVRALYRQFRGLPADRRQAINREVRNLRRLSEADRQAMLGSEDFRNRFSADERKLIEDAAGVIDEHE
jgi:hypothetical protein